MKKSLISLLLFFCSVLKADPVDLVVFSFNRPMQLYAFLESVEKHVTNVGESHVIFRSSDIAYTTGYDIVKKRFPNIHMHMQHDAPHDFKPLLLQSIFHGKKRSPYVMFAVDDMIMTEKVDLSHCTRVLKKHTRAWFFSLRLGKNITFCGMLQKKQKVPKMKRTKEGALLWKFSHVKETGDWDYPNTTDTTIYRKKDIKPFLTKAVYENPNRLEEQWARSAPKRKYALCYAHSKTINIPMNVVNPYYAHDNMHIKVDTLLDMFLHGQKIDIDLFYGVNNPSPHVKYEPKFCRR